MLGDYVPHMCSKILDPNFNWSVIDKISHFFFHEIDPNFIYNNLIFFNFWQLWALNRTHLLLEKMNIKNIALSVLLTSTLGILFGSNVMAIENNGLLPKLFNSIRKGKVKFRGGGGGGGRVDLKGDVSM